MLIGLWRSIDMIRRHPSTRQAPATLHSTPSQLTDGVFGGAKIARLSMLSCEGKVCIDNPAQSNTASTSDARLAMQIMCWQGRRP